MKQSWRFRYIGLLNEFVEPIDIGNICVCRVHYLHIKEMYK